MNKVDLTLYLVAGCDDMEESVFLNKLEQALQAGITLLQLREKEREGRALYHLALKVNELAKRYRVPLLIDDRVDVAMAVDAAGVHVGQSDLPVSVARRLLGPDKIVGATAKTVEQAVEARDQGADYLGVGAIYPTTTKVKTMLTKVETLADICRAQELPAVAIGGLNKDNLEVLRGSGFAGVAVVTAIMKHPDIPTAVAELLAAVKAVRT